MSTKIEWAEETWNPIIGCSKVSPGCDNCYAEKMANRLSYIRVTNMYKDVISDGKWNKCAAFRNSEMTKPSYWTKPKKIFVCSMGDLFHESVPDHWINEVFQVMNSIRRHTYFILTKRPEKLLSFVQRNAGHFNYFIRNPHVWVGVTAENQNMANKRIPILLQIPAQKRFVSIEPMLGPVDLTRIVRYNILGDDIINSLSGTQFWNDIDLDRYDTGRPKIDWVICGGESGSSARPMHPSWPASVQRQCAGSGTPFFFKQWGEYQEIDFTCLECKSILINEFGDTDPLKIRRGSYVNMKKVGKAHSGNLLYTKSYNEYPI